MILTLPHEHHAAGVKFVQRTFVIGLKVKVAQTWPFPYNNDLNEGQLHPLLI
jgi:hypothetical protein